MIQNLAAAAERLRSVRKAERQFLALWTLECLAGGADVRERPGLPSTDCRPIRRTPKQTSDWSYLYLGSVLDD